MAIRFYERIDLSEFPNVEGPFFRKHISMGIDWRQTRDYTAIIPNRENRTVTYEASGQSEVTSLIRRDLNDCLEGWVFSNSDDAVIGWTPGQGLRMRSRPSSLYDNVFFIENPRRNQGRADGDQVVVTLRQSYDIVNAREEVVSPGHDCFYDNNATTLFSYQDFEFGQNDTATVQGQNNDFTVVATKIHDEQVDERHNFSDFSDEDVVDILPILPPPRLNEDSEENSEDSEDDGHIGIVFRPVRMAIPLLASETSEEEYYKELNEKKREKKGEESERERKGKFARRSGRLAQQPPLRIN
jgi:hypothetical protein